MITKLSTDQIFYTGVNGIQNRTQDLVRTLEQATTGRRILTPADDPIASARVLETRQSKSVIQQFMSNISYANDNMALFESQLNGIEDIIKYVRREAVHVGNGVMSDKDISYIAQDMNSQFDALLTLANTRDSHGDYMFSGYRANQKPYTGGINGVTYHGDQGERSIQVSSTRFMPVSVAGVDIFDRSRAIDTNAVRAAPDDNPTTNDALYSYKGINNKGTSGGLQVGFDTATVDPQNHLGKRYILNYSQPDPAIAGTWQVQQVNPDGHRTTVPHTVNAGPPVTLAFNGLTITPPDDPPPTDPNDITPLVDGDHFEVFVASSSLFENYGLYMSSLNYHPDIGVAGGVAFALDNLDRAHENVLSMHTRMGAQMKENTRLEDLDGDLELQYDKVISRLEDADYTKVISDMVKQQTYLQAAQLSFSKVASMSLFNYLS